MTRPKVTVVLVVDVTEGNLEERVNAPFVGKTLPTIKSIEDQTWPHELLIMRNVEGHPSEWMLVQALKQVTTDWVAFIDDGEVWPDVHLMLRMLTVLRENAHSFMEVSGRLTLLDIAHPTLNWKDIS